jgi:hypothetical protein
VSVFEVEIGVFEEVVVRVDDEVVDVVESVEVAEVVVEALEDEVVEEVDAVVV